MEEISAYETPPDLAIGCSQRHDCLWLSGSSASDERVFHGAQLANNDSSQAGSDSTNRDNNGNDHGSCYLKDSSGGKKQEKKITMVILVISGRIG